MSSCKEEEDGDGEARDIVEGSTDMMVVGERREGLLYLHAYVELRGIATSIM